MTDPSVQGVVLKAETALFVWCRYVQRLHLSMYEWKKVNEANPHFRSLILYFHLNRSKEASD